MVYLYVCSLYSNLTVSCCMIVMYVFIHVMIHTCNDLYTEYYVYINSGIVFEQLRFMVEFLEYAFESLSKEEVSEIILGYRPSEYYS